MDARDQVRALYEAYGRRDWDRAAEVLHPAVVVDMPATAERLEGRDAVIEFQRSYPEPWGRLGVRRVLGDSSRAVAEIEVIDPGGRSFAMAGFWAEDDGLLLSGVEYWVTVGGDRPAPGRATAFVARRAPGEGKRGGPPVAGDLFPLFRQAVLDATDARGLAEFYRELLGMAYRAGDEPPSAGEPDYKASDWLVLRHPSGSPCLAFQQVTALPEPTWPEGDVPQQLHLDLTVKSAEELALQHARVLELGARLLVDRSSDEVEPIQVYADPAGHPFCIFVASP